MSAGIPVIASDFPLWRQVIENNGCGLLADPTDPLSIARAVEMIIREPDMAEQMGKRGRHAVETNYNWEIEETKLIQLYENLFQ
jgi:glycosyltransferase involved in cell wall biosynthesis